MIRRILILFFLGLATSCQSKPPQDLESATAQQKTKTLTEKIEQLQKSSRLPALQAFVVNRGKTEFKYSQGVRAMGSDVPVEMNDVFPLGVASKTMTSILVAQLIDQGLLKWDSTVGSILTQQKMHPSIKNITIETLLGHTSGLVAPETLKVWPTLYDKKYSTKRARELLVQSILATPANFVKGKTPEYNSSGYIVLGAILEHMTNFSWEELVQNKIFNSIGMKSCSFGFYGKEKVDKITQPWPHEATEDGYKALSPDNPKSDFPPAFAAAGNLRCNAEDWIRFLMELNYGLFKESTFLAEKTYMKLFNTVNEKKINLAHFGASEQMWGGGQVFFNIGVHDASISFSTIVPRREAVLVVFTNAGDKSASKTTNSVLKLLKEYVEDEK
ncbi:MAG: beta-lactamase family protein [Bdellovibrionaceae bacterium]|nr:beta-lactamase family protein [Pseudobdellovibrionaceae bacterium]